MDDEENNGEPRTPRPVIHSIGEARIAANLATRLAHVAQHLWATAGYLDKPGNPKRILTLIGLIGELTELRNATEESIALLTQMKDAKP